MMREPQFWWQEPGLPARLLAPCSAIYGAIAAARLRRRGERAAVPVICVGNFTVGGGGKTPTAIALARLVLRAGLRPAFLTRGYGGRLAGPLRVDPAAPAADVGDEPLLLAHTARTILARDRAAGARLAADSQADVIVMDDGLQNPSLIKNVALAALDGRRGIGNAQVIPAGPLRAPLAAQLERTDAVLLIGDAGDSARRVVQRAEQRGLPVFSARLEPSSAAVAELRGRRVLAYAGIADPGKFFATLADVGISAAAERRFPDHYPYTAADAAHLLAVAERTKSQLVTTEKDHMRLVGDPALAELAARSLVLPVELVIEDEERLRAFLSARTGLRL